MKPLARARAAIDTLARPAACSAGCSHCCQAGGPLITVAELHEIVKQRNTVTIYGDDACPFLEDNQCSIYEHRPLACRAYRSNCVDACIAAGRNPPVDNLDQLLVVVADRLVNDLFSGEKITISQAIEQLK